MSMNFAPPQRKPRAESIVPMINVVFLLLIFFLMTSTLSKPEPFDVTPPEAQQADAAEVAPILYLGQDGKLGFEDQIGDAAVTVFVASVGDDKTSPAPQLRADAQAPATRVAAVLKLLAQAGLTNVSLVVAEQ
ncbi:MAG: biopolymer transport protein ExbD [Celeribacter sp.]|jgi:biopolymer transport protein ExbD